jgi:hypothetical protein
MNIQAFFASLGAALLSSLSSVGASVAAGFATIIMSFTADQRGILLNVKQKFHDSYASRKAAGAAEVDAIEGAATDAYNEFCNEEGKEFSMEASATIILLESAAKQAAGIVGTMITGGVQALNAAPQG